DPVHVLFLCTGNSTRSIMAESLMNHWGRGSFRGRSAGSYPTGTVRPEALALLRGLGLPTEGLRSKSWDEFASSGAPVMDFVFTVCDQAAAEPCPIWPGRPVTAHPVTAHWGVPDPAAASGSEIARAAAFRTAFQMLERRIKLFVALPIASLDRAALAREVAAIGDPPGGSDTP
ncbi:MAG TPA: arsenate reductase ArsC, partial [Acetobacteraceae bacterium]|nr:arsenate reductase ArsC [Acetobacteraceae bacterium]